MGNSPVNRGVSRISDQSIPSKRTAVNSLVDQISDAKLPNLLIYKDAGKYDLFTQITIYLYHYLHFYSLRHTD
jgi:hypothetical protein